MHAEKLPDGRLRIPLRAVDPDTGMVGDGSAVIGPDHPDYDRWLADATRGEPVAPQSPEPGDESSIFADPDE